MHSSSWCACTRAVAASERSTSARRARLSDEAGTIAPAGSSTSSAPSANGVSPRRPSLSRSASVVERRRARRARCDASPVTRATPPSRRSPLEHERLADAPAITHVERACGAASRSSSREDLLRALPDRRRAEHAPRLPRDVVRRRLLRARATRAPRRRPAARSRRRARRRESAQTRPPISPSPAKPPSTRMPSPRAMRAVELDARAMHVARGTRATPRERADARGRGDRTRAPRRAAGDRRRRGSPGPSRARTSGAPRARSSSGGRAPRARSPRRSRLR